MLNIFQCCALSSEEIFNFFDCLSILVFFSIQSSFLGCRLFLLLLMLHWLQSLEFTMNQEILPFKKLNSKEASIVFQYLERPFFVNLLFTTRVESLASQCSLSFKTLMLSWTFRINSMCRLNLCLVSLDSVAKLA